MRERTDADHLEAAIATLNDLIWQAQHTADYEWDEDGASGQLLDCYVENTPQQKAAAVNVAAAYNNVADALRAYRSATKRALDNLARPS